MPRFGSSFFPARADAVWHQRVARRGFSCRPDLLPELPGAPPGAPRSPRAELDACGGLQLFSGRRPSGRVFRMRIRPVLTDVASIGLADRSFERLLGKKQMEVEILQAAQEIVKKSPWFRKGSWR